MNMELGTIVGFGLLGSILLIALLAIGAIKLVEKKKE